MQRLEPHTCDWNGCENRPTRPVVNTAGMRVGFSCSPEHSQKIFRG